MTRITIKDIAAALGADAAGDVGLEVTHASEPASAGPDALALALSPAYAEGLSKGKAKVAVVWAGADWGAMGLKAAIFAPRGRLAMAGLTQLMDQGPQIAPGIHPTAIIDRSAVIGANCAIGPFVFIGADVIIGPNARIASHVSIETGAQIGADAMILNGVRIGARVRAGDRFIVQPGASIGNDGFSFVTPQKSGVEEIKENLGQRGAIIDQPWVRIHSLGSVLIGDDVEIGANSTIDRGTIRDTAIGAGTKLDNLVHVAHNVVIGRDCLLCGQVGIAGSVTLGDRVVLAGQTGVKDNIFIGNDVISGASTKILSNVPAGRVIMGYPAMKMDQYFELSKMFRRLPRLFAKVDRLAGGASSDRDME